MFTADIPTPAPGTLDARALAQQLNTALRASIFGSRLTITPRRIGQIADSCAESFQRYAELQTDNETVQAFGEQLAQAGLGHSSLLALIKGLQDFVWGQGELIGEARAASCYCLPLLAGYMAARETYLLAEQERTRLALERAQQHAGR